MLICKARDLDTGKQAHSEKTKTYLHMYFFRVMTRLKISPAAGSQKIIIEANNACH